MTTKNLLKNEEAAVFELRKLYSSFGYQQFKMSKFEEYDLYVRNKSFLVSDHIITFTDTNGKLMALKPDVTLSIVKNSKDVPGCVQKVYYNENVYRVSGSSRSYKEIMQVGLECLGDIDDYAISEVVMLAAESLARISPDFVLDISHLGLLSAAIDATGISDEAIARASPSSLKHHRSSAEPPPRPIIIRSTGCFSLKNLIPPARLLGASSP
jgi:ATP phosphoribosyltransferase regulatory subunit